MEAEIAALVENLAAAFAAKAPQQDLVYGSGPLSESLNDAAMENEVAVLDRRILPVLRRRVPQLAAEWCLGITAEKDDIESRVLFLCLH